MTLNDLNRPFTERDLEWRIGSVGLKKNGDPWAQILCYVDARAVMDRLDKVCGQGCWQDEYQVLPTGVKCKLSIKIGEEWVSKEDGSPETKVEGFKGGLSKALVRAGVKWGIGRYLYETPVTYATIVERGTSGAKYAGGKTKKGESYAFYWKPKSK